MVTTRRTSLVALLCGLVLLASACGGSSSGSANEVASGAGSSDEPASQQDAAEPATSSEPTGGIESPLADLLGIPLGDGDEADQYFNDLGRQAEVKIAECMINQGFEYQVVDYSQIDSFDNNIDFESREFAEEYGFGIASNPFEESFEAFESFEDPNRTYVENLTDGERQAYESALYGEFDESGEETQVFEPSGCQGEAFDEVFAFGMVFEQFGDQFEEIEQAYEADPRIVGATTGWSSCMSESGHSFSDQEGAEQDIQRRYDAILGSPDAFADDAGAQDASIEVDGDEEFIFGPQSLNPQAQAQVDELAVEERVVALASWDCNGPLREIEDEVRIEYEQRFVDENGAAIRAALGE